MPTLETRAKTSVVALPEHGSMICAVEHQHTVKRVMREMYDRRMGYEIEVK